MPLLLLAPVQCPSHLADCPPRHKPEDPISACTKGCFPFLSTFSYTTCIKPTKLLLYGSSTKQRNNVRDSFQCLDRHFCSEIFFHTLRSGHSSVVALACRNDRTSFICELRALLSFACAKVACGAPIGPDNAFNLANVYVTLGWKRTERSPGTSL